MASLGFAKDALACAIFVLILLVTTARGSTVSREWLQLGLGIAILVDGSYTLVPSLHNTRALAADSSTLTAHALYVVVALAGAAALIQNGVAPLVADRSS